MKPLVVLIAVFIISTIILKLSKGSYELALSARIAMSVMLLFTSLGHFKFTNGMAMMVPEVVPYKTGVVYITGIIEIIAAITLLIPSLQVFTGWFLIVFYIALLPANIFAALNHIDYEHATRGGNGRAYLWFRIPLQLFFIAWTYFAAIRVWTVADPY